MLCLVSCLTSVRSDATYITTLPAAGRDHINQALPRV